MILENCFLSSDLDHLKDEINIFKCECQNMSELLGDIGLLF